MQKEKKRCKVGVLREQTKRLARRGRKISMLTRLTAPRRRQLYVHSSNVCKHLERNSNFPSLSFFCRRPPELSEMDTDRDGHFPPCGVCTPAPHKTRRVSRFLCPMYLCPGGHRETLSVEMKKISSSLSNLRKNTS